MFCGIVKGIGTIVEIIDKPNLRTICVRLPQNCTDNLEIGASIANNGCCLTITNIRQDIVKFDIMAETLSKTNLKYLQLGDSVNIERAARFGDEIGGHVMSGHIIDTVEILDIKVYENNKTIFFRLPENLKAYIFTKGFIGLDGCSLTVGDVFDDSFNVHLIPETLNITLFGNRKIGDEINLEIDASTQAIVDTVERLLKERNFQAA